MWYTWFLTSGFAAAAGVLPVVSAFDLLSLLGSANTLQSFAWTLPMTRNDSIAKI